MNELSKGAIEHIVKSHNFKARKEDMIRETEESRVIHGIDLSRRLTQLYREIVTEVLRQMDLPDFATVALMGSMATERQTLLSDFDLGCFVPQRNEELETFAHKYRPVLSSTFAQLGVKGDPVVWGPDFLETSAEDQLTIASMCNELEPLHEGSALTIASIQGRTREICKPIEVASLHEKELIRMRTMKGALERIEFDCKDGPGGLRNLQHTLWFLLALTKEKSSELYAEIFRNHPEVQSSLDLLLHLRSFFYLHHKKAERNPDIITGKDWTILRNQFGNGENDIILRLHQARLTIANFSLTSLHNAKKRGMVVDGIRYGVSGLTMRMENMESERIIRLLVAAQRTGLPISPSAIEFLAGKGRTHLQEALQAKGNLFLEPGGFSRTLDTLLQLEEAEGLVPGFQKQTAAQFDDESYRHADVTKAGRAIQRNSCLEELLQKDPITSTIGKKLTPPQKAGIRIALTIIDIPIPNRTTSLPSDKPEQMRAYRAYCYDELGRRFPQLTPAIDVALFCLEKHKILFDCAIIDDWNEEVELERIAREVGTVEQLHTLLAYTCAVLDYCRDDYFSRFQWRKMFGLYSALEDHMTGGHRIDKLLYELSACISPEHQSLLQRIPRSLHHSGRMNDNAAYRKTLKYLDTVQATGVPSITIKRIDKNTLQIVVSAVDTPLLPAIISHVCYTNEASIDDAEIYSLKVRDVSPSSIEKPLVISFFEVHIGDQDVEESDIIHARQAITGNLLQMIEGNILPMIDIRKICSKAQASFTIEPTKASGKYKLIISAGKDIRGFLLAITSALAQAKATITRMGVYTLPKRKGADKTPIIRDIFTLETEDMEEVRRGMEMAIN